MKITIPESPTLTRSESAECLGNGLLVAIATGGLCYLFEKNAIVPCTLAFLLVSLSCAIWAQCEARGYIKVVVRHPEESTYMAEISAESWYDDEAAYDEDEDETIIKDEFLIPETEDATYPKWFNCPITKSLGTAKAHALFDVLLNDSINRSSFCSITGKTQSEYAEWLQSWFDLSLLERKGKKVALTYRGNSWLVGFKDEIEKS